MGDAKVRSPRARAPGGQGPATRQGPATGTQGRPRMAGAQGPTRSPAAGHGSPAAAVLGADPFFGRPSTARGQTQAAVAEARGAGMQAWDARFPWERRELPVGVGGVGMLHTTGYGQQHSRGLQVKAALYDDSHAHHGRHERMDTRQLSALHKGNPAEYAVYMATGAPDSIAMSTSEAFFHATQRLTSGRGHSYADALARGGRGNGGAALGETVCSGYARNLVPTGPALADPSARETALPRAMLDPITAMHIKQRDPIEYANMGAPSPYATTYGQTMGDGGKRYYFG